LKITKISLTNFRSFKETQIIELAPVTLLFGPNSVGKSSVLMSLAYVQQILFKGHCNPQKLDALAEKSIGGFKSLVHGQDTNSTIKIRLDFEADATPFDNYSSDVAEMANHIHEPCLVMDDFGGNIKSGSVELEIAWAERQQHAFVRNYRVWINKHYIGCINASDDLKNTIIKELNTEHPLLIPLENEEWLNARFGELENRELIKDDEIQTEFEDLLNSLNPNSAVKPAIADVENANEQFTNRIAPIALSCRSGAIPILSNLVITNLDGQELEEIDKHFNFLVIRSVLSQAFVLPLDQILAYLNKSILIGPLRIVPNNEYAPNPHPEQANWFDGSAAWDLIYKNPKTDDATKKLIKDSNAWFAYEDKINAGYEILNQSLAEELNIENSDLKDHNNFLNKRLVSFKEKRSNILLSANQLGTGISQVLPIVVAANIDQDCLISIEQPELHIHPRLQVELGDLFLENSKKHSYLIETHSEHLILRLLKRVRQSSEEVNNYLSSKVNPTDISIIYLEPSDNGVLSKRICIDEDGEFEDRWPDGFFSERREELM
jgi:AAA15 family ATPase/GTPase